MPRLQAALTCALVAAVSSSGCATGADSQGERPLPGITLPGIPLPGIIVYQSDFGLTDGAVAAMHGVARGVEPGLVLEDLTHEIPPYDVYTAAYRLVQAAPYWPAGTVFVSVVDPGVGTARRSVVLRTRSGHYFVSPDNGTLDVVAEKLGVDAVREIDEARNRREQSGRSHTFHGRDVYSFTAARLASGAIDFEAVGPLLAPEIVGLGRRPAYREGAVVHGSIPVLDERFGNVWTDVDRALLEQLGIAPDGPGPDGPAEGRTELRVAIARGGESVWSGVVPLAGTFGDVPAGAELAYWNSLEQLALGRNQADFARTHGIGSGPGWTVEVQVVDSTESGGR